MSEDIIFDCLHAEIVNYCLEDNKENDFSTLEYIGYTTGFRLIELLTRDVARFKDELETIKYICTDFWTIIYKKQVDNLRTNNQGMYVVQDKAFRFLTRISPGTKLLEHAPKFVAFTCGLVRGALSNLGINSTVTAEVQSIPACKFHIEFISRLQKIANSAKKDSSFTVTLKRYNGHDKPKPREGKPALPEPEEYMCLMRAQSKSKKISTVVKHDDVPKMMTMYAQFMKGSMDGLKRVKKVKSKAKAAKG